jgi:hypothetical protein
MQSVPITTKLVSWNPVNGEVYSIQDGISIDLYPSSNKELNDRTRQRYLPQDF